MFKTTQSNHHELSLKKQIKIAHDSRTIIEKQINTNANQSYLCGNERQFIPAFRNLQL
jgi:hypothetical protein